MNIEELRKVYAEAVGAFEAANLGASGIDAGLAAVARFVAERQRAVEPTEEMMRVGHIAAHSEDNDDGFGYVYRAMSAVAPLVVPE